MKWETPAFVEINMSAEIGGYGSDFTDRDPWGPVATVEAARKSKQDRSRRDRRRSALTVRRHVTAGHVQVRVLGSAAGGGVPQWNCGCENCREARRGTGAVRPRTQETVAVSADGTSWFLLNVSPEIRAQIESFPPLTPREPRHSPIAGLMLTNGDLDHCLGLLSLRESHPLTVYATESVRAGFTGGNVLYRTLERFEGQVTWRALAVEVRRRARAAAR